MLHAMTPGGGRCEMRATTGGQAQDMYCRINPYALPKEQILHLPTPHVWNPPEMHWRFALFQYVRIRERLHAVLHHRAYSTVE